MVSEVPHNEATPKLWSFWASACPTGLRGFSRQSRVVGYTHGPTRGSSGHTGVIRDWMHPVGRLEPCYGTALDKPTEMVRARGVEPPRR
jgi:hypothetical protein